MNPDSLLQFILYYAKFIPKTVLDRLFVQPDATQRPGYSNLRSEMLALPEHSIIPEIQNFMFSLNTKFLSDSIKDAKGFLLFVEYGEVSKFTPVIQDGIKETVGITVAHEFNIANNDSINETLLMNQSYNIIIEILKTMYKDMRNPENCPVNTLINFPAKIQPVESQFFFDHCGWSAVFERYNSIIF